MCHFATLTAGDQINGVCIFAFAICTNKSSSDMCKLCLCRVPPAQQMLLLCQGVSGMRKDGESVVWNQHKHSFQGESPIVNRYPQSESDAAA